MYLPAVAGGWYRGNDVQNTFSYFQYTTDRAKTQGITVFFKFQKNGVSGRNRTCNLLVRSQALYPLSYGDEVVGSRGIEPRLRRFTGETRIQPMPLPGGTQWSRSTRRKLAAHGLANRARTPASLRSKIWRSGGGIEPLAKRLQPFSKRRLLPRQDTRSLPTEIPPVIELVPSVRFERTTRCLQNSRSTN